MVTSGRWSNSGATRGGAFDEAARLALGFGISDLTGERLPFCDSDFARVSKSFEVGLVSIAGDGDRLDLSWIAARGVDSRALMEYSLFTSEDRGAESWSWFGELPPEDSCLIPFCPAEAAEAGVEVPQFDFAILNEW